MRTSYDNVSTTTICQILGTINEINIFTNDCYELIKELSFRQLLRMALKGNYELLLEVAHTTATNVVIYLNRTYKTGFKVTNWIRFIFNKSLKTYMAMYDFHGNVRPQIIEFEDYTDFLEYRKSLKNSAYIGWKRVRELEVRDYIKSCGNYLEPYICSKIIYAPTHKSYNLIKYSILFGVLQGYCVFLYGLSLREKEYVISLYRYISIEFPRYFKECIYNDFSPDINEGGLIDEERYFYKIGPNRG